MGVMKRSAFTLIEVLLVLAVMAVLAVAGIPMLRGSLEQQRLRSAADQIRGECHDMRLKAMEDGQILCLRCQLGGSNMIVDRILDAHFTAGFSTRETTDRFDALQELDSFEKGDFTGETEDFILKDPGRVADGGATQNAATKTIMLPEAVFVADVLTLPDERSAFYLGLTTAGADDVEENMAEHEMVSSQNGRYGETAGSDGSVWSTPIFFYPDGTTSAVALLLKNDRGQCMEVRLRGLTGLARISAMSSEAQYAGELDVSRQRTLAGY